MAREHGPHVGAALHVIHVVPPVTDPADAPAKLERLRAKLGNGVQVETELLTGRVARHIVDYAREHAIGLIVVGTHGRTGVSRALLGSVAEAVVRLAPCPVLTVSPATMVASRSGDGPGGAAGQPLRGVRAGERGADLRDLPRARFAARRWSTRSRRSAPGAGVCPPET